MAAAALFVGLIGILTLLWWMLFPSKARKLIDKIPGPKPLPIIGNAHQLERHSHDFFLQIMGYCKEYKKDGIIKILLGPQPRIGLFKAHTVEAVLNSTKHMAKSLDYTFLHPWMGTGLLTSSGDKWHVRRKLITPTFHFRILQDFQIVFNEQSHIMVKRLKAKCGKEAFDIFPFITFCALDVICDTAMGKHMNAQGNNDSEYVKALFKISEVIQNRQKAPWFWPDFLFNTFGEGKLHTQCLKVLHGFTEKVIKERSAEFEEQSANMTENPSAAEEENLFLNKRKKLALLDMLLFAARGDTALDFMDIREEVDTFMFEGHDTTSAAMIWAIFLIGSHPEVQQKVHEEMDRVFGDDRTRDVTMDDMKQLKYLECCIKESLRLYPSVPIFGREFSEDCEIGGYQIPKGAYGVVFTFALHRDPEHFPEPNKFDPNRWLPENSAGRHPYCYVPFSAGMRNCIGQKFAMNEEKVMLSSIFRNFKVESCQQEDELRPMCELVLRPENGIIVKLTERPT